MGEVVDQRDGRFPWERRARDRAVERASAVATLRELAAVVEGGDLHILLAVPGDDVHVAANQLGHRLFTALRYRVTNLGVSVPADAIVDAASTTPVDAVVLSSLNGHALRSCGTVPAALRERGVGAQVFLGGNVVVGRPHWPDVAALFHELGFTAVYPPSVSLVDGAVDVTRRVLAARGIAVSAGSAPVLWP